jgi:hypothetical protein
MLPIAQKLVLAGMADVRLLAEEQTGCMAANTLPQGRGDVLACFSAPTG